MSNNIEIEVKLQEIYDKDKSETEIHLQEANDMVEYETQFPPLIEEITKFINKFSKTNFDGLEKDDKLKLARFLMEYSYRSDYGSSKARRLLNKTGQNIYENIIENINGIDYVLK
jgi:hypothetical protein